MSTPEAPAPATVSPCDPMVVPLRDVERELTRQLKCLQDHQHEAPVVRAGLSNLVIYCDSALLAEEIGRVVPDIVAIHPARVLMLVHEAGQPASPIEATVHTRMHRTGKGLRAFSEQVTLRASGRSGEHLPYAVRSLLIGDLPTNLWWAAPQPPAMAGSLLYDLSENADQVLYDSYGWPQPARGMMATAPWLQAFERGPGQGRYRVASDLTWRRLRTWRRVLAEALDPATAPGALESISRIEIDHGPHSVTSAWSLLSWLVQGLGWSLSGAKIQTGVEIEGRFRSARGPCTVKIRRMADAPQGIRNFHLVCHIENLAEALNVYPEDDDRRLAVDLENDNLEPRTVTMPQPVLADLVARQLSDRERDPVFLSSMIMAEALARSVLEA